MENFKNLLEKGVIDIHWERDLDHSKQLYGFAKKKNESKIPCYSANNLLVKEKPELKNKFLIIEIYAEPNKRKERLKKRSSDLSELEKEKRLSDDGAFENAHLRINNENDLSTSTTALMTLINKVISIS